MLSRKKTTLAIALVMVVVIGGLILLSTVPSSSDLGLPGRFVSSLIQVLQRHNFLPGDPLDEKRSIREINRDSPHGDGDGTPRPFYVTLFDLDRDIKMVSQMVGPRDLRRGMELWREFRQSPALQDPQKVAEWTRRAAELIETARSDPAALEEFTGRLQQSKRFRQLLAQTAEQPFAPELSWGPSFAGAGLEAESRLLEAGIGILRAESLMDQEKENRPGALRSLSLAARLATPQFVAPLENQKTRAREMQGVVDQWSQFAREENDGARIERNQRELNQLALHARDRITRIDSPPMRDLFSRMQRLSPEPYDRFEQYSPGELASEYKRLSRRYLELYEEKGEDVDPGRLQEMRQRLDGEIERIEEIARAAEFWNTDEQPEELPAYGLAEDIDWTQKTNLARIDLLRLENAEELYRRMGFTEELKDLDVLTPVLMNAPPTDPTCERPYVYDARENFFYALGPDGEDNGARILYDPSNGTRSAGDIYLPAFRAQDLPSSPTRSGP